MKRKINLLLALPAVACATMRRTALAIAVLCACLPDTLVAQDREARLAAIVEDGRNGKLTLVGTAR